MKSTLKAPAKKATKTKKAKEENMVFDRTKHTAKVLEGKLYREYHGETTSYVRGEEISYSRYGSNYRFRKGRTTYKITRVLAYDKKGVVFEFSGHDFAGIYPSMYFKDAEIALKKAESFALDTPYIISQGRRFNFEKHVNAWLYIPVRYFEEIGYKIKKEVKKDEFTHITTTKWYLDTKYFTVQLYSEEVEDFESQKKQLIAELRKLKKKKDVSRKDVVEVIEKYSTIRIPYQYTS